MSRVRIINLRKLENWIRTHMERQIEKYSGF